MTSTAKKILDEALALPDDERAALMEALSDSFAPEPAELSPEWSEEIESRIAQLERGEVEPIPWADVENCFPWISQVPTLKKSRLRPDRLRPAHPPHVPTGEGLRLAPRRPIGRKSAETTRLGTYGGGDSPIE